MLNPTGHMKLILLTAFTLIAFAANSLLCRMALGGDLIDPISFTAIRLVSGALILIPVSRFFAGSSRDPASKGSWGSGFALFVYAAAFSLAYITLTTGMGALILFGMVQVTMVAAAVRTGERLSPWQWLGFVAALIGLVYLVLPGLEAPNPVGALLMGLAGIAWGIYSLRGRGATAPIAMTAGNFLRATPFAIVAGIAAILSIRAQIQGVVLALTSGVVTSGLGYVLWYQALRGLNTTQASVVQLLVPVLAAFAGVVFLAELVSARLVMASALILGGVLIVVVRPRRRASLAPDQMSS